MDPLKRGEGRPESHQADGPELPSHLGERYTHGHACAAGRGEKTILTIYSDFLPKLKSVHYILAPCLQ